MDTKLKQRLLGAIVILALIIIFLPMLFNRHAKDKTPTLQEIPNPPAQPSVSQTTDQSDTTMVSAQTSRDQTTQPTETSTDQSSNDTTVMSEDNEQADDMSTSEQQSSTSEGIAVTSTSTVPPATVSVSKPVEQNNNVQSKNSVVNNATVKTQPTKSSMPTLPKASTDNQVDTQITDTSNDLGAPVHDATSNDNQTANDSVASVQKSIPSFNIRESNLTSSNVAGALPIKKVTSSKSRIAKAAANNKAYVVQLGYFGNPTNAKRLVSKLRSKGFTAYGYQTKKGGKTMTHVFVGPAVKRAQAEQMKAKLFSVMKMKGMVVNFDPKELN